MTAAGTEAIVHHLLIDIQKIQRHKRLNRSCQTAAVDAPCAMALQHVFRQGQRQRQRLMPDIARTGYILQLHEAGMTRFDNQFKESAEILILQSLYLQRNPRVFLKEMNCPE